MSYAFFDSLESRRLLTASLAAGVLTVGGTGGDDVIEVFRARSNINKLNIVVNGELTQFVLKDVAYLNIRGFDGKDKITLSKSIADIAIATKVYGDRGSDTIVSDISASIMVNGGAHDDFIDLRNSLGSAVIYGEDGNDTVYGAGGMYGPLPGIVNPGRNLIFGGAGNDALMCTDGESTMYGGEGNDSLYANNGDNLFDGGSGNDLLSTGVGDDIVYGGDGQDNIITREGRDIVY